jgi:hypothetical protein
MYFANIAAMLAQLGPISTTTEFTVGGFYDRGDGGGGTFIWVPIPGGLPEDFGIIFYSTFDPNGYFQRIFSGPVNVRWFGAIYDPAFPLVRPDLSGYIAAARASEAFANNGTLYFPKGTYPGSFDFTYGGSLKNEFNIIGDGEGTILKSSGRTDHSTGMGFPILYLGNRSVHWRWAKVSNLQLDGSADIGGTVQRWSDGIMYTNLDPGNDVLAGRWKIDQVLFNNCIRGVHKPYGNIGNHYIDCTWRRNDYGVYAIGYPGSPPGTGAMHFGCDKYSGCEFDFNITAVHYEDINPGGGQIIFDGTAIHQSEAWGILIKCTADAQFTQCAISLRSVYFEYNGFNDDQDLYLEGIRSVRVDDGNIWGMTIENASVNLFNCSHVPGGSRLRIDDRSSLVAYEHRYLDSISEKLFVNSISYDATPELTGPWRQSSVWGPLRAVTATKDVIVLSTHFDVYPEVWDDYGTIISTTSSWLSYHRVLGTGSNMIYIDPDKRIWSKNAIGDVKGNKYTVWSIHTYTESYVEEGFYGEIMSEDEAVVLGRVYFKQNQWVCSYGMRWVSDDLIIRLVFRVPSHPGMFLNITDYQIVQFDDLASANSFVNSREFAIHNKERNEVVEE